MILGWRRRDGLRLTIYPGKAAKNRLALGLTSLLLWGCSPGTFLSESGPTRGAIVAGASQTIRDTSPNANAKYAIVEVNDGVLARMVRADQPPGGLPDDHTGYHGEIGVGDMIGLTIFESDSGGLFLPREPGTRPGNYVTLPTQQVDHTGNISVPYAGKIRAAGLLPDSLRTKIESLLAARAVEPQVVVTIADRRAGPVSVLGEVGKATTFTIDPGGETLLGALSRADGPKYPAYESMVSLQRDGRVWRTRVADVERDPRLNIKLRPRDAVYVSREQRYFVAMGAIGQGGSLGPVDRRIPFQDNRLSLMDALGRAGGLNDGLANPRAVFIYRLEHRTSISLAGPRAAASPFEAAAMAEFPAAVPTVYLVDLNDPAGFFYASRFPVHGEDVVYVANAPASDLQKFLAVLTGASGSSSAIAATVR